MGAYFESTILVFKFRLFRSSPESAALYTRANESLNAKLSLVYLSCKQNEAIFA